MTQTVTYSTQQASILAWFAQDYEYFEAHNLDIDTDGNLVVRARAAASVPRGSWRGLANGGEVDPPTSTVETDIDHIIDSGSEEDREDYFIQNFGDHCSRCPYVDLCLGRATPESLIEAGMLRSRRDHHAAPAEQIAED